LSARPSRRLRRTGHHPPNVESMNRKLTDDLAFGVVLASEDGQRD
jgi:hypothetical protein